MLFRAECSFTAVAVWLSHLCARSILELPKMSTILGLILCQESEDAHHLKHDPQKNPLSANLLDLYPDICLASVGKVCQVE
jgi:hypothetical protein